MARPIFQNILLNMQADTTLRDDHVFDPRSKFPVPKEINREMDCLKFDRFMGQKLRGEGNDATNTEVYENEDYY